MSLYNQTVSNVPLSLDGLYTGSFNNITINGLPFDPTALVPYTGATKSINLNNKQLTNASLISTNALKILTVPVGTQTYILAIDSAGNVIRGTIITPTQLNLTSLNPAVVIPYYFSLFSSNASGSQTAYIDSATTGLKYLPFTQTFYCNNLNIASVPVGTGVYTLAVDSGGSVVQSTASSTATLMTVYNVNASGYIPIFNVNSGNATANMGYSPSFNLSTSLFTFPANLTATNLTAGNNLYVNGTSVQFSSLPLTPPSGTFSGYAAVDTAGNIYKATGVSSQPTITSGTPGAGYAYLLFGNAGANQTVYVDPNASLQYNLTYSSLALGANTIPFTSLLSPSAQFVIGSGSAQSQVNLVPNTVSYACLSFGSFVQFIFASAISTPLTVGQKVNVSGITTNPLFNNTYTVSGAYPSTTLSFYTTTNPSGYGAGTYGYGAVPIVQYTPINVGALQFTSTSVLGPTPIIGDNSTKLATTAFVSTALSSISGYLAKTGTQTGINTILQLTAGGNFTLQTSAAASLFTVIDAVTTIGNDFKILKTSFPTLNISSSAIGTNRLTQFVETTAATTYSGTNTGDSIIIATNSLWHGVPSGYITQFMNGTASMMNLTRVLLSGNQSILALGSTSDATSIIRNDATTDLSIVSPTTYLRIPSGTIIGTFDTTGLLINSAKTLGASYIVSSAGLPLQLNGLTALDLQINGTTTAFIQSNQFGIRMGSMFNFSSAGNWNSANCLFVTSGGFGGNNPGVGLGYSTTDNTGYLTCISPNVSWQAMTYKANTHVFYAAGNSLSVSIDNTNNLILGSSGAGITNNSGDLYGSFRCVGNKNGWFGITVANNRQYLMSDINGGGSTYGLYDQAYNWSIRTINSTTYFDNANYTFNQVPQQNYLPNQTLIGNNGTALQWGVQYSAYYTNTGIAWGPGIYFTTFYKASATSYLRVSGSMSHYISAGGMTSKIIRFYNSSTGGQYDYYIYQYTNYTGNHVSYPIMVQTSSLPAGQYYVYAYAISNIITDANDSVYLLFEICWA